MKLFQLLFAFAIGSPGTRRQRVRGHRRRHRDRSRWVRVRQYTRHRPQRCGPGHPHHH